MLASTLDSVASVTWTALSTPSKIVKVAEKVSLWPMGVGSVV
jgi:hypothetical protein